MRRVIIVLEREESRNEQGGGGRREGGGGRGGGGEEEDEGTRLQELSLVACFQPPLAVSLVLFDRNTEVLEALVKEIQRENQTRLNFQASFHPMLVSPKHTTR